MKIAVAGGTGVVGSLAVAHARALGHDTVVLSRSTGVDIVEGDRLVEALAGVDAVIDASNVSTLSAKKAIAFFERATRVLVAAEHEAGVAHHVALSIVGIDRVPTGYYQGKLAQEREVEDGYVPWTVLRATQFHEFAGQLLDRVPGPLVPVPPMRSATVAAREVAEHLIELATAAPAGIAPELAGPEVHDMADLVRRVLRRRGSSRRVVPLPTLGAAARAAAGDGLLPTGDHVTGTQTFDEWLATV